MHKQQLLGALALLCSTGTAAPQYKEHGIDTILDRHDLADMHTRKANHDRLPHFFPSADVAQTSNATSGSNATAAAATSNGSGATPSLAAPSSGFPSPYSNTSSAPYVISPAASSSATECAFSVWTSTTTVHVTVTVAMAAKTRAPWVNGWNTSSTTASASPIGSAWSSSSSSAAAMTAPCDDESTAPATPTTTTWTAAPATISTEPCDDMSWTTSSSAASAAASTMTDPCDDEWTSASIATAPSTEPCDDMTTTSAAATKTTTQPCNDMSTAAAATTITTIFAYATSTTTSSTSTPCVIDTSITPVTTAPLTSTAPATAAPTTTVCAGNAPAGPPMDGAAHCGVHGLPVGDFFLARFVENAPGVPVSLEGCFQFCQSVYGDTRGCQSYAFYAEPGLGAPRCDLYGSSVAYALASIDDNEPELWFDLACGDPASGSLPC